MVKSKRLWYLITVAGSLGGNALTSSSIMNTIKQERLEASVSSSGWQEALNGRKWALLAVSGAGAPFPTQHRNLRTHQGVIRDTFDAIQGLRSEQWT
jgi:hypothetical protein